MRRRSLVITVLGALVAPALAIAINAATGGTLPGVLGRYQGWSWLAVGVLVVAGGGLALAELPGSHGSQRTTPVPAELPRDIRDFTGRGDVVRRMCRMLSRESGDRRPVVVSAITGMAGVGKTTLVVHVGHLLRAKFPDGQLYVNLRGAQAEALDPFAVLGGFLGALGMVDLPGDLDSRARAYRTRIADRRMLVVLDNAANEDQIAPLLPGTQTCAVVVTSRRQLVRLAGADAVVLDIMTQTEAVDLLSEVIGAQRVTSESASAGEIARLCGYLPIAVRIAGGVLTKRPNQPLAEFAEELRTTQPLATLTAHGSDELLVGFSLSYRGLSAQEQRLFRLLGLLDVADFPDWVGTALVDSAGTTLDHLVDARLLEDGRGQKDEAGQNRYRFHDLLREFARQQLTTTEPATAQQEALLQVMDRYLALSAAASARLRPLDANLTVATGVSDRRSFQNGSLAWFTAEHVNLVILVDQASRAGLPETAWKLTMTLEAFFERGAHWDSWRHTADRSLAAVRDAQDTLGEAHILRSLGYLMREIGQPHDSLEYLIASRERFRELGDEINGARVLCNQIRTYRDLGRYEDAVACYRLALPIARQNGDHWLEANLLRDMGMAHRDHGDSGPAVECFDKALPLFRQVGDELMVAYTVRDTGMVQQTLGQHEDSTALFRESLADFERLGDRRGAARALNSLGSSYRVQRRWPDSITCFHQSLDIFREIGDRRWESYTLRSLGDTYRERALTLRTPRSATAYPFAVPTSLLRRCLTIYRRPFEWHQWRMANYYLVESRAILKDLADGPWEAHAALSLGDVYLHRGRLRAAAELFDQALEIFRSVGNQRWQADALIRLGHAHLAMKDWLPARNAWRSALLLARQMGTDSEIKELERLLVILGQKITSC